jgi:hypothetical protein
MITPLTRTSLRVSAVLYAALGVVLFAAPDWSAANFAWKISAFVAMTMGGWCIGNAYTAWDAARIGNWSTAYGNLVYLWVFGVLEGVVIFLFREKLLLGSLLAAMYMLTLGSNVWVAILLTKEWIQTRPALSTEGHSVPTWVRGLMIVFILFVGFLALYGWVSGAEGRGADASIFPEPLSMFSLRAFASFYAALATAVVPMLWAKGSQSVLTLGKAGMSFIVAITIAAFVYLNLFNFSEHPGQLLYMGAYVGAFFVLIGLFMVEKRIRAASPIASRR